MLKEKETEFGVIRFDKKIIADMVSDALDDYSGKVWLGDYGSRHFFKGNGEDNFVDIEWENELKVTIYVILKFGTSISSITESILSHLSTLITDTFGDIDRRLKIVVTGVQVREQIAKRHIEVEL